MIKSVYSAGICALLLVAAGCGGTASTEGGATSSDNKNAPLVGSPAPDFSLPRANGEGTVKLSELKGKVVLIDFWATWCEPCRKSFPKYQELYVKYKGRLEIIGVSEDDENNGIEAFGKTLGVDFPLVWDDGKALAGKWNPKTMPSAFVVDKEGVVRFAHFGYNDGDEAQLEKELKELF